MFNLFKGNKPEFTVTLDRPNGTYAPGETISITVEFKPNTELKLQGAQAKLSCMEHYELATETTDSDGTLSKDHYWGKNEFFVAKQDFLSETTLPGGYPQRYSFQMELPAHAPASCSGEIIRIEWHISVKLERAFSRVTKVLFWITSVKLKRLLAPDWHAEPKLLVFSLAPSKEVQLSEYGESNEPNEVQLALRLPGLKTAAGQVLSGQLRILPHKGFTSAVRVELVCTESVPYDCGNQRQKKLQFNLAESTQFIAGQEQAIPFQIPIPQDGLPSIKANNGSITWTLRGVLDRRLRQDTIIEQNLEVCSARG